MHTPLILASASPQRARLLDGLGVEYVVIPSKVDEEACTESDAARRASLLAYEKSTEVASRHRGRWVLGCDTLVELQNGDILEKPQDEADAERMLRLLSGRACIVHSGMSLIAPTGEAHRGLSSTTVEFLPLDDTMVQWWIAGGLWQNRSGAFQIDGSGQLMIKRIDGDWSGVVGLPVCTFGILAREAGLQLV